MPAKTLDELEGEIRGGSNCHQLRTKPVDEFTVEDLRVMIGQKVSLRYLMPKAVEILGRNPLAEGSDCRGDLLANVIECSEWLQSHPYMQMRITAIAKRAVAKLGEDDDSLRQRLNVFLADSRSG